jgi:hypothetical protein
MYFNLLVLAIASAPLAAAHGKIAVVSGDAGGNGTGLGILGGVVPGPGRNKVTEVDTTVFNKRNIMTDGLGKTSNGPNTAADLVSAMAQSGSTLPQVSATNGTISGTFHIVTSDGAGPLKAVIDPTGTGAFSTGTMLETVTQVPGRNGNIRKSKNKRLVTEDEYYSGVSGMLLRVRDAVLGKRATNINEDFPMAFSVPSGMTCSGSMGGQNNVCLVKIANSNGAGPFGGVIAVQMASGGAAPAARDVKEAKSFQA